MSKVAAAEVAEKEAITGDRDESKFLLPRAALPRFVRALRRELPQHHFEGEGANKLPNPEHFVTTVYFDTPSHAQLRAALENGEHNVKIRAREYYDLHGSLAELATDPSQIVRYQPWVWFEIKRREGARTHKDRFRLYKGEVTAFFEGHHAAFQCAPHELASDLAHIVAYRRSLSEPLVPSCVVNYQRLAFQDQLGTLRITVDVDIGFYAAPPDLWTRTKALVRGSFGAPSGVERHALIEVKRRGETAPWLADLLARTPLEPSSYSKFVRAGRAVHGIG